MYKCVPPTPLYYTYLEVVKRRHYCCGLIVFPLSCPLMLRVRSQWYTHTYIPLPARYVLSPYNFSISTDLCYIVM